MSLAPTAAGVINSLLVDLADGESAQNLHFRGSDGLNRFWCIAHGICLESHRHRFSSPLRLQTLDIVAFHSYLTIFPEIAKYLRH